MNDGEKMNKIYNEFDVEAGVRRLQMLTNKIHALGLMAVFSTGFSIASFIFVMSTLSERSWQRSEAFIFLIFFAFSSIAILIARDALRKTGESLFDELSDEVQWFVVHKAKSSAEGLGSVRPPLGVRYELRRFARNTDLPLVPGSAGTTIYVLLNLILMLVGAFLVYGTK